MLLCLYLHVSGEASKYREGMLVGQQTLRTVYLLRYFLLVQLLSLEDGSRKILHGLDGGGIGAVVVSILLFPPSVVLDICGGVFGCGCGFGCSGGFGGG